MRKQLKKLCSTVKTLMLSKFFAEKHLENDLFRLQGLLSSIGGWPLLNNFWDERLFHLERLYADVRANYGLNTMFGLFLYPLSTGKQLTTMLYVSTVNTRD